MNFSLFFALNLLAFTSGHAVEGQYLADNEPSREILEIEHDPSSFDSCGIVIHETPENRNNNLKLPIQRQEQFHRFVRHPLRCKKKMTIQEINQFKADEMQTLFQNMKAWEIERLIDEELKKPKYAKLIDKVKREEKVKTRQKALRSARRTAPTPRISPQNEPVVQQKPVKNETLSCVPEPTTFEDKKRFFEQEIAKLKAPTPEKIPNQLSKKSHAIDQKMRFFETKIEEQHPKSHDKQPISLLSDKKHNVVAQKRAIFEKKTLNK